MKHGDPGLKRVVLLSLSLFRKPTKYEQLAQNLPGAPVLEITRIMYWRRDSPYKVGIGGKDRANWKPWALARIQEFQVFIRLQYHLLSFWLCFKNEFESQGLQVAMAVCVSSLAGVTMDWCLMRPAAVHSLQIWSKGQGERIWTLPYLHVSKLVEPLSQNFFLDWFQL
jgi:hypothetical protein